MVRSVLVVLAATLFLGAHCAGAEGEQARFQRGNALFLENCARCHGASGIGDGPEAGAARNPVADLTRIAERHGGVFPAPLVAEIVDGRRHLRSHGPAGMPVWGKQFGPPTSGSAAEAGVKDRIRLLVEYLAAIQVEPESN